MIHPSAIVHPDAKLGSNVAIGPYSISSANMWKSATTRRSARMSSFPDTRIGTENRIFQFCSIGEVPQDKKYAGEPTRKPNGNRNTIREFCTFNVAPGTASGCRGDARGRRQLDHGLCPLPMTARLEIARPSPTTPSLPATSMLMTGRYLVHPAFTSFAGLERIP